MALSSTFNRSLARICGKKRRSGIATHKKATLLLSGWFGILGISGCHGSSRSTAALRLCTPEIRSQCLRANEAEDLLIDEDVRIVDAAETDGGSAGAKVLTLEAEREGRIVQFRVKWRPHASGSSTNAPRKEVVAYFAQALFLEPADYVFPPTRSRCFELEQYRKMVDPGAQATFEQAGRCVFGVVSFWIEGAKGFRHTWWRSEPIYSQEKWNADAVYRASLADANLLSYLTSNGDTHRGNWLTVPTGEGDRVYLIDNSISLTRMGDLHLDPDDDYANLLVPALREQSLDRLLHLSDETLGRLLLVEQLEVRHGTLVQKRPAPPSAFAPSEQGLRFRKRSKSPGEVLLVGLAPSELLLIRRQLWYLRARFLMGEITTLAASSRRSP